MVDPQLVIREVVVPPDLAGQRVDKVAAELFGEFSRASLAGWIHSGELTVDSLGVKPKSRVRGGERLSLNARILPVEDWASPQTVAFDVVYEDDAILVIDKPAGLVVHPGAGNPDGTLVNGLLAHRDSLALVPRAGIIHRLDKDTSGLLLVAATLQSRNTLAKALEARAIERRYLAVTEGRLVSGTDVDLAIGRDPHNRVRQKVRPDGRPALTRVRVMQRFSAHSLVEAELATGRTHQIRVHLASIGYPLVGDRRYGARGRIPQGASAGVIEVLRAFPRQALHAWRLGFEHPESGERLMFESPLPADMVELVDALEKDS